MPPKRKAANPSNGRSSKRGTSGVSTPQSISSNDDFSDSGDEGSASEQEAIQRAIQKFSGTKTGQSEGDGGKFADFSKMKLKPDHENRPMWINESKQRVYLESWSPLAKYAQDFLITIAEPLSRPHHIHEYHLTANSLYAAVSVGLTVQSIINSLQSFCKTPLPAGIIDFIVENTKSFGKVKLLLKDNRYYLESSDPSVLQTLMQDETIRNNIVSTDQITSEVTTKGDVVIPGTSDAAGMKQQAGSETKPQEGQEGNATEDDILKALRAEDEDDEEEQTRVHSVEIPRAGVEKVARACLDMGLPALEEYDFQNDKVNPNLAIDLKPNTKIRYYQEIALSKMFANARARSGIIVLPCGAGKTLVGITAACTIRKSIFVLCTSSMSVVQWRNEFLKWSNISPNDIAVFTSDYKETFSGNAGIIVSTYSMVTQTRARSHDAQKMMDFITQREWGLMILDEVHVVPASIFRKVTREIGTHCKLGLTATLVREDDKIKDLNFLIGPKLYEANWQELSEQGHIAKVQCSEVWCNMPVEFFLEYQKTSSRKKPLLYIMNPNKFQMCQFLIDYHEKRGDKIIVFSDNVYALQRYALKLNKAYIYGGTPQNERMRILENFQHNEQVNTIFLSKIGDTSLDLPEATCLIQISSHYGSRRQEAQRLGRILRAKRRNDEGFNAFFYSLVSKDTQEMVYSAKRQMFLVDQGYSFRVITALNGMDKLPGLAYDTPAERRELLQEVMLQADSSADVEAIDGDLFSSRSGKIGGMKKGGAKRTAGTLSELSGGRDMAYIEYNKSRNKELKSKHNPLFKKMAADQKKRRQMINDMNK